MDHSNSCKCDICKNKKESGLKGIWDSFSQNWESVYSGNLGRYCPLLESKVVILDIMNSLEESGVPLQITQNRNFTAISIQSEGKCVLVRRFTFTSTAHSGLNIFDLCKVLEDFLHKLEQLSPFTFIMELLFNSYPISGSPSYILNILQTNKKA